MQTQAAVSSFVAVKEFETENPLLTEETNAHSLTM